MGFTLFLVSQETIQLVFLVSYDQLLAMSRVFNVIAGGTIIKWTCTTTSQSVWRLDSPRCL